MTICENCNKEHNGTYGSGRFCSSKCARSFATKHNREEINKKTSEKLKQNFTKIYYYTCKFCDKIFISKSKKRTYCNTSCQNLDGHASFAGKVSAASRIKRSKNEILFADLCIKNFNNVKTNVVMFNGWDADIVIEDLKLAILWNGPWHYVDGLGKNHSLKQVRNRDKIKIREIAKAGLS